MLVLVLVLRRRRKLWVWLRVERERERASPSLILLLTYLSIELQLGMLFSAESLTLILGWLMGWFCGRRSLWRWIIYGIDGMGWYVCMYECMHIWILGNYIYIYHYIYISLYIYHYIYIIIIPSHYRIVISEQQVEKDE